MAKVILPLSVSAAQAVEETDPISIAVSAYANTSATSADAPVLISLESADTIDVDEFARQIAVAGKDSSGATARLMINAGAAL